MDIKNEDIKLVADSELFDENWYRQTYADINQLKDITPLEHFMKYGWIMRRDPSVKFSVSRYLDKYKDIKKAKINPLLHYLMHGRNEGRLIFQSEANITSLNDVMNSKLDHQNLEQYKKLEKENKNLQEENDMLLTELHRTQEELERIYIEKK